MQTIICHSSSGHIVTHVFMIYLLLKKSKLFKKDKHKDEEELRYDPLLIKCPSVIRKKSIYGNFYTILVVNHNGSVEFLFPSTDSNENKYLMLYLLETVLYIYIYIYIYNMKMFLRNLII